VRRAIMCDMTTFQHLPYPGVFTCTECNGERCSKYTNVLTCGDRCRKRRSRRLAAEAAAKPVAPKPGRMRGRRK